jgi:hypothetical protein
MHRGGGGAVRKQLVTRLGQAIGADFISVAGHSTWAVPNIYGLLPVASRVSSELVSKVEIAHIYPAAEVAQQSAEP